MPRDLKAHEHKKRTQARRMNALARLDLRQPSSPREPAFGPTSHAVKKIDMDTQRLIAEALAKRGMSP